jgi:malto-oligosyltrehalose trehalohydrolase
VRFRLWAPAAQTVELLLWQPGVSGDPETLPMGAAGGGWFEIVTGSAGADWRYRYRIDGATAVPDPAARANDDVHGASIVVDPLRYEWGDARWQGRPWHEAICYELHVGTYTPEGTFAGVRSRLGHLAQLGVTMIELMPLAEFPGRRGWGYDGVLPYAPDAVYGGPDEFKALVDDAHAHGIGVMLDVVYNHFGPEGNRLHAYAPQFFTDRHHTPWGDAMNFDGPGSEVVRQFFVHNALYWLEEYRLDGLRIDAVHAIRDDSPTDFVTELVQRVREGPGRDRHVHVALENDANEARRLGPPGDPTHADAQWSDDFHHCLHVLLTGERDGYYADYAERAPELLARCLAEGFAYQGEHSQFRGRPRGEKSTQLPPTAFVTFLQNHDQVGNRAYGERLATLVTDEAALRAATAILLLAPSPPLLFMGEEWAAPEPFPFFCDLEPALGDKVREGRRKEFSRFLRFGAGLPLPDPTAAATFDDARLDWSKLAQPRHAAWLDFHRRLLAIRTRDIVPVVPRIRGARATSSEHAPVFAVDWLLDDGAALRLVANVGANAARSVARAAGQLVFTTHPGTRVRGHGVTLPPWSVTVYRVRAARRQHGA